MSAARGATKTVWAAVAVATVLGLAGVGGAFGDKGDSASGAADQRCTDGDATGCYDGDGDGVDEAWCPATQTCNVGVTVPAAEATDGTDAPMGDGDPADTVPAPNVQTTVITVPPTSVPGCATATAQPNESWSVLAERYGVKLSEILGMNGLPPDTVTLLVGQVYCRPGDDSGGEAPATTTAPTTTAGRGGYDVPGAGKTTTTTSSTTTTSTTTTTAPKATTTTGPVPKVIHCTTRHKVEAGESWGDIGGIFGVSGAVLREFNNGPIIPVPGSTVCIPGDNAQSRV